METLVVKRSDFAQFDITHLKARKLILTDKKFFGPIDIKIVFVSPLGHTETVYTNGKLFNIISDGDKSCIIYGEMSLNWECGNCDETFPYTNDRHKLLITDVDGTQTKGWLCSYCAERDWGIENA